MNFRKIFNHKCAFGLANFVFLLCGIVLLILGFYLYADNNRLLLSRLLGAGSNHLSNLPQPLFYYIAIGLTTAGLIAVFASVIGWWAVCLNTYWILSINFLTVLLLLIVEFGMCLVITLWPQCLGLNLDEMIMVKILQGNYGVPGKEQFTAAMDLVQTNYNCCAINSNINYDTSLWRLQGYGQRDYAVPLSCCQLENRYEIDSYLDPKPINITTCQSLQREEYENSRHIEGCLNKIEIWYRQQYVIFLGVIFILALAEFCILLTIILSCTKIPNMTAQTTTSPTRTMQRKFPHTLSATNTIHRHNLQSNINNENIYLENNQNLMHTVADDEDIHRDVYIQPPDLFDTNYSMTFKPMSSSKYQYQISKSYLV